GPTSNPYDDHEDRYTMASSASTAYTMGSQFTTNTDTRSIPVSSRLSRHNFKIKTTSSFPSILNLYQEPIREEETMGSISDRSLKSKSRQAHNKKHPRSRSRKKSKSIDWSGVLQNEPRKSENRTIRIEAVAREQMDKYESYIKNLTSKVERQRQERQKREELFEERLKAREEEERLKYSIRKRPKQGYVHDNKYLKKLPKSKLSRMVHLSDDLQKKGVLKSQHDVEKFWKDFGDDGGVATDIFKRDPLTEVPDNTEWVSDKSSPRRSKSKNRSHKSHDYDIDENGSEVRLKRSTKYEESGSDKNADGYIAVEIEVPTTDGKQKKSKHRRKSNALPPLEKKRDKHRKKAKSWPDRDQEVAESEPRTGKVPIYFSMG
ncbi:hypothetical protein FSP39_020100, partial [Pinctada imbricata]